MKAIHTPGIMRAFANMASMPRFTTTKSSSQVGIIRMGLALTCTAVIAAFSLSGASAQAETVGYTADVAGPFGGAGNNGGLNIGHTFTVTDSGITVYKLGVYDYQGNGLNASHVVALFSLDGGSTNPVAGGSVTVPSGTAATLQSGFRFMALAAPVTLPAGNYAVIVYQMNGGGGSDGYAEANNTGFIGDGKVSDISGTFNFDSATFPTYPGQNSAGNLASCSFTYMPNLTASDYAPIALAPGSYNQDAVVELGAPSVPNGASTTVSMDGGTGNNGNSWYEMGYDTAAVKTGIPTAGSTIGSALASDHYYTFAPSYAANDVAFVDASHSSTLTLASPGYFYNLSFMTAAANGPVTINYTVNYSDGTSETGTFNSLDWFFNSPAWLANGRVDVVSGGFDNVNNNNPNIYTADISLGNPGSQVLSINLSTTSGGRAVVFAVSGYAAPVQPPIAPYNIAITTPTLTKYEGGTITFTVTANGTRPFDYQWYKGISPMGNETNATLTLAGLGSGDATNYSCTVGNPAGTNASSAVVLSVLPLPPGVPGTVLADGPLAYYRLNETGPLVADIATNSGSLGAAGNGMHFPGLLHQVPGAIAGDSNTAAGYTGIDQSSCDGAVPTIVPYNAALNPNGSFTVEAWLKPAINGLGNAQMPMRSRFDDGGGNRNGWDFFQRDSSVGWNWRIFNGSGSGKVFDITGGAYTVGQWCHLVAVYDANVPSATLYLNGEQVAQSASPNGSFSPNPSAPLSVGGYEDATENPFIGSMDEFAIYPSALSADQVLADYQNGTNALRSTSYSSLVLSTNGAVEYLRLDEPAVNVAVNNGSLGSLANGVDSNTGTPVSGPDAPIFTGFEATNLALFFNGSDYVELVNPPGLNFAGQITLEAWIQPAASQSYDAYIVAHGYNDSATAEVNLRIENGQYQVGSYNGNSHLASFPVPVEDLTGSAWVHLAGTYDGANWNLYRNGALVASNPDATGAVLVNNANWAIGARGRWKYASGYPNSGLERQFTGTIDEVAIYDHALTPARIQAHYAESIQPLTISSAGGQVTLNWVLGTLVQSTNVIGPYTPVSGATSPFNLPMDESQQFFRIQY